MSADSLQIDGQVERPLTIARHELAAFTGPEHIPDVSQLDTSRTGEAVTLAGLLTRVIPLSSATHVTLHSSDGFSASIPLSETRDRGIVLFQIDGESVPDNAGGPFRFLIPNAAECKTAELDACANVKGLIRIELTSGRGRDTR